jgi:hypothetical protein
MSENQFVVEDLFPYGVLIELRNNKEPPANGRKYASKIIQGEEGEIRV